MPTSNPGSKTKPGIPFRTSFFHAYRLLYLIQASNSNASYTAWELHTKGRCPIGPKSPKAICFGSIYWQSQTMAELPFYFTAMPLDYWLDLVMEPHYGSKKREGKKKD